jgi:hypothetical protein
LALVSALTLPLSRGAAQEASEITLVVKQNGREIGRETFTVRDHRARDVAGSTVISTARYPASDLSLAATIERTPKLALEMFQMDVDSAGAGTVIYAAGSGARLILRTVAKAKGSETGRELPGGPDVVLLDDAIFSLYAQVVDLATVAGRPLMAVFPRTGRRAAFTARREPTAEGGIRVTLAGGIAGTLVADARSQLISLELPASQVAVTRPADGR